MCRSERTTRSLRSRESANASTTTAAPSQCAPASSTRTAGTERLASGVDPVVDKENLLSCLEKLLRKAKSEMAIAVVRRRDALEPTLAVRRWSVVLPDLDQTYAQVSRDQCAQQRAARGRTEDHRRLRFSEQLRKGRSESTQELGIPPPARDVSPAEPVRPIACLAVVVEQRLPHRQRRRSSSAAGVSDCLVPLRHPHIIVAAP